MIWCKCLGGRSKIGRLEAGGWDSLAYSKYSGCGGWSRTKERGHKGFGGRSKMFLTLVRELGISSPRLRYGDLVACIFGGVLVGEVFC